MIRIKNLSKKFGGLKAVNECSFEIETGKITALIGPNGAGKTTVFNLISGLLKADDGKIIFDGKEITNMKIEKISNLGISRMFQHERLFGNLTIKENMILALDNKDMNFWENMFYKCNIDEEPFRKYLKNIEMERYVNRKADELSYGQKRLIELGRTILNPHKLLMLDEPVAGVTPPLRKKIAELLKSLENETVLLIEHDMQFTLNVADKVIVMDEGKVIAEGTPAQIKRNKKVLEAYLGA